MKILYIFPHPDDESFGPAGVIHKQIRDGHEVYLLTLTRGESTKVRYQLNLTEEQMAELRFSQLQNVARLLRLSGLKVLSLKDNFLAQMNPLELEEIISEHIRMIRPDVLVTFPVHGISGHHDHLTTHYAVKRAFSVLKNEIAELQRLAFITLPREENQDDETRGGNYKVNRTAGKFIDAVIELDTDDRLAFLNALDCYPTFQQLIQETDVKGKIGRKVYFEIFDEDYKPPISSLTEGL